MTVCEGQKCDSESSVASKRDLTTKVAKLIVDPTINAPPRLWKGKEDCLVEKVVVDGSISRSSLEKAAK